MTKYLIALLVLTSTSVLFAKDCGKKLAIQKNSVVAYFNCKKGEKSCVQLKDVNDGEKKLNDSSKVVIGVDSASYGAEIISIKLTQNGACWIEKLTSENVNEEMSLVVNDVVLSSPIIAAPIKGDAIQIQVSAKEDKGLASVVCKNIDQNCRPKEESSDRKKNEKDLFYQTPSFDRSEINEKYGSVMESAYWYTEKSTIPVYETSQLKKIIENYTPPVFKNENKKDKVWFNRQQEFDYKTKKFVFSGNAVKIMDLGWVKREDMVPANVLKSKLKPESAFFTSYAIEKCSAMVGKAMQAAKQGENFLSLLKEHSLIFRNSEIGFCATEGERICRAKINEIKAQVANTPCEKLL
ncbi:hypothetical protein SHI21_00905 [Bacteriovorax sp. PP10]|uniref:SecDF P1 head subdomain domain-containing protein n=1 Tax=Bacteriovorax antarcticus TaxID=3088717 RepID=A0ABU5VNX2_9BACT|nr:hypothetical protein [Bacteriovorax sp. PP10]MEA9354742.1 hypothetical protein [Bacteriovorax sp. PP10]